MTCSADTKLHDMVTLQRRDIAILIFLCHFSVNNIAFGLNKYSTHLEANSVIVPNLAYMRKIKKNKDWLFILIQNLKDYKT